MTYGQLSIYLGGTNINQLQSKTIYSSSAVAHSLVVRFLLLSPLSELNMMSSFVIAFLKMYILFVYVPMYLKRMNEHE